MVRTAVRGRRAPLRQIEAPRSSRPRKPALAGWFAAAAIVAADALLLARLAGDVRRKPLFEDEAVAGLIAARPLGDVLDTVWDRGGAPAHFVLVHALFAASPSPDALRWLSVAFALATVPVSFDLGRRLGGPTAGAVAALVVASSGMLGIYGSFGRMYALFAFAAALAADLFLRALERPHAASALAAAAAAWLAAASHPYGAFVVGAEAVVALTLWRGRPLRPALPTLAVVVAMAPLAVLDLRLAGRFAVGVRGGTALAGPGDAWGDFRGALGGFAGGAGVTLAVFAALAVVGLVATARRRPAYAVFALLALGAPFVLFLVATTGRRPDLSPRHLIYALPLAAAFIGAGAAVPLGRLSTRWQTVAVAALAAVAVLSPDGIRDPRSVTYAAPLGHRAALREPAAWLRRTVTGRDVLYPFSAVYLAGLPETGKAVSLPRGQPPTIARAVRRARFPVARVLVAVPAGTARFRLGGLRGRLAGHDFGAWVLVEVKGPFDSPAAVLHASRSALVRLGGLSATPLPGPLRGYLRFNSAALCLAVRSLDAPCV